MTDRLRWPIFRGYPPVDRLIRVGPAHVGSRAGGASLGACRQQAWRKLTFINWRVDADAVARLLPDEFTPDLIGGDAWVTITPFLVPTVRVAGLTVPFVSGFAETNLRTYVRHRNGVAALWLLSIDASSTVNVVGGRTIGAPRLVR